MQVYYFSIYSHATNSSRVTSVAALLILVIYLKACIYAHIHKHTGPVSAPFVRTETRDL